jgi:hypothetical protein
MAEENNTSAESYNPLATATAAPASAGNPLENGAEIESAPENDAVFNGIDFDTFNKRSEGVSEAPAEETTSQKENTEGTEDTKSTLEAEKPDETSAVRQPFSVKKPIVLQKDRDFSGIDEEDKPLFRDMSKTSFDKLKQIYVQNKANVNKIAELEAKVTQTPESFKDTLAHPEAYRLDDSYKKLESAITMADSVEQHYIDQLEKISKGEQWNDLGVDGKGNPFIQPQGREPNVRSEQYVRGLLTQVQNEKYGIQKQMSEISQNYSKNYQNDVSVIRAAEEKYFPGYDKPDHPTRKTQEGFLQMLPPSQRKHPLASVLAKTVANNGLFQQQLQAAQAKIKELETKLAAASPAQRGQKQPTASNISSGNKPQGNNPFEAIDFSDFQKRQFA